MTDRAVLLVVARLDSQRLPGKALRTLGDRPVLGHVLQRAASVRNADRIILATTDRSVDDPLARYAASLDVDVYRGKTEDVANRILDAAGEDADILVRINGDSPFMDPELVSRGITLCKNGGFDFVTNIPGRTFPYGIAVEIFRKTIFRQQVAQCTDPQDLEHATPCLYKNFQQLKTYTMRSDSPELTAARLVIDTANDLNACQKVCEALSGDATCHGYKSVAATYLNLFNVAQDA